MVNCFMFFNSQKNSKQQKTISIKNERLIFESYSSFSQPFEIKSTPPVYYVCSSLFFEIDISG